MAGTTAEAQVEKKCYRNQTAGNLGVVTLDHLGAQVGTNVVPFGQVWLTDNEATLTARAPADPKDNPFIEQKFLFEDAAGAHVAQLMRPLVLVEDQRYSPSDDRYIPGADVPVAAIAAGQADTAAALAAPSDRPIPTQPSDRPVPILPPAAAVPAEKVPDGAPVLTESWTDPGDSRTVEPQPGALSGSVAVPGPDQTDVAQTGSQTTEIPQPPAPQAVPVAVQDVPVAPAEETVPPAPPASPPTPPVQEAAAAPVAAEETAAITPLGEETGAAAVPEGPAPEGEFAAHEEVGSPDAPKAEDTVEP